MITYLPRIARNKKLVGNKEGDDALMQSVPLHETIFDRRESNRAVQVDSDRFFPPRLISNNRIRNTNFSF